VPPERSPSELTRDSSRPRSWPPVHLDRGYDNGVVRSLATSAGIGDLVCSKVRPRGSAVAKKLVPLGMRWAIERTNSWLSNFGQLRRNTDRRVVHRLAQLALAVALLSPPSSSTGAIVGHL
jgi:hypothetical protein